MSVRTVGKRLDSLGPALRLSKTKQLRAEELLAQNQRRQLTAAERRELDSLLRQCDGILSRRAAAMNLVS